MDGLWRNRQYSGAPGAIDTALVQKMHDAETRRAYLQAIPMGRYGLPEEVAAAAVYLALLQSSYITGIASPVDGSFMSNVVLAPRASVDAVGVRDGFHSILMSAPLQATKSISTSASRGSPRRVLERPHGS